MALMNETKSLMRQSFILFNYKWKDTIKSLGLLQYGIPYSRVPENSCSSSDKITTNVCRICANDF